MILSSPGAVAFEIFGLEIYWYGIIMAFSILIGTLIADWAYRKQNGDDLLLDLMPLLVLVGFTGARIYYCLLNFSYYLANPLEVFNVRQGGLSIHGMFFACLIFLVFYCKKKNLKFFSITAPMCLGVAFAQCIGRWGNFFNSEAFGKPFDGFLKLYIPPASRPAAFANSEFFHPTFLYESILDFGIFLILFFIMRNRSRSPLFVTSLYFLLYALARILVESLRIDSAAYIFGLPVAIVVSVFLLLVALLGILLDLKFKIR